MPMPAFIVLVIATIVMLQVAEKNGDRLKYMPEILAIIGALLILLGLFIVLCNYVYLLKNYLNRKRNIEKFYSLIPLFGALLLLGGSFVLSVKFRVYFLLIFIFDHGTSILLISVPRLIKEFRTTCKEKQHQWKKYTQLHMLRCFFAD